VSTGRNNLNSHAATTTEFGIKFFRRMSEWLIEQRPASSRGRILDFGCADLRLARPLDGVWRVDGWDEWPSAREAAREMLLTLETPGIVHERLDDIPPESYDAVVVGSMFQYTPDVESAQRLFAQTGRLLARDASVGIVINDAVSDGSNPLVDLRDLVVQAFRVEGPLMGPVFVVRAIRSGRPSKRHKLAQADLAAAARRVGLELTRHPENLSTFTRRATFVLRHAPEAADQDASGRGRAT
jgi:hypothetical protein